MKLIKFIMPICLLLILLFSGCTNIEYSTFNHNGEIRKYILYLPDNLPENAPLVFVLHGYGSNGLTTMRYVNMNSIADEYGFAVCYPQGLLDFKDTTHWNARLEISDTDDIGFLSELAKYLQSEYNLNEEKTFSCGHSNGGFMSYTLACEAPDVFKAIASVAGTMSGYTWDNRNISTPKPILHIHGTDDKVVPIDGSLSTIGGWGGAPHVDTIIEFWVDLNNCTTSETEFLPPSTNVTYHMDGINGNEVWYYKIDKWGHGWPSYNPDKPDYNPGIDTSEVIWEFFSKY
jgi:polyhydroxybutyrate depolymerase